MKIVYFTPSPPSPYEPVSVVKKKQKTKETEEPTLETRFNHEIQVDVSEIKRFLGRGAFNCAHLISKNNGTDEEVLRIGLLLFTNQQEREKSGNILRGASTVHFLQRYRKILGPSLVLETAKPALIPWVQVPEQIRDHWCENLIETVKKMSPSVGEQNIKFLFQHLEYLSGGTAKFENMAFQFQTKDVWCWVFSLLWFISHAQKFVRFKHSDIKGANIVFRLYKEPVQLQFRSDESIVFTFKTYAVPVIIDYDLSTTEFVEHEERYENIGSYYTAPPEFLISVYGEKNVLSYDWWSVGIVILEMILDFNLYFSMWKRHIEPYANFVNDTENLSYNANQLKQLCYFYGSCILKKCVSGDDDLFRLGPTKQDAASSKTARYIFSLPIFPAVDRLLDNKKFKEIYYLIQKALASFNGLQPFLNRLLSWNPDERIMHDFYDWDVFKFARRRRYKKTENEFDATLIEPEQEVMQKNAFDDIEFLKSACVGCQVQDTKLSICTCCAKVYCGNQCHSMDH